MRMIGSKVLVGLVVTLAFTTLSLPASSQAIAESALLGGGSSTATAKAGSALNSALNKTSKEIAGRIPKQLPQPVQRTNSGSAKNLLPKSGTGGSATPSTAQPSGLIVSIQRAEPTCPAISEKTSTRQGNAGAEPAPKNCLPVKPESQKYKSVVTLSAPK
jgi:hypothetical protein